jgi:hypothetical protein
MIVPVLVITPENEARAEHRLLICVEVSETRKGNVMKRWIEYLWRGLAALGEANYSYNYMPTDYLGRTAAPPVDISDDASMRAEFCSIVEWEWGSSAFDRKR